MKKKLMALALCTFIGMMAIAGFSLAWLQDTTAPVTNTFTEGKVDIDLYEHDYLPESNTLDTAKVITNTDYKMIPGKVLPKDPTVEVLEVSEACWLFIKVEKNATVDTFLEYSIDTSLWKALDGVDGVYYIKVEDTTTLQTFNVLADKKVTVKTGVTMDEMNDLADGTLVRPELKFTAYAIQQLGFDTEAAAWAEVSKASN